LALAALSLVQPIATPALAQTTDASGDPFMLDHVVVTARVKSATAFELPASISAMQLDGGANRPNVGLSEYLDTVPGLLARDRQNHAQDTQLSIRGFGARATFGVRGLRLYSDGIPATMPDGQGQISHFSLLAGDRIEVMRGPFSALHGNSSGGVIQLWSADGASPPELRVQGSAGRYDSYRLGARLLGAHDAIDYNIAAAIFDTQGYRRHSAAQRRSGNIKIGFDTGHDGRLTLVTNLFDTPRAQDPLGLTWEQVRADPRQASPSALQYDTRKRIRQNQIGLRFEQSLANGHSLNLMSYGGSRRITQYLSVPVAVQNNPLHAGGISDLGNEYGGIDARWSWQGELSGRPFEITAGGNFDKQRQHRRGFENFIGDRLGVRGALRRDEMLSPPARAAAVMIRRQ
jgi:iron complex outermembrane receptor protein